ncbi:unnamed protein product [Adineta steineri]|uniref:Uncharacterized protein n=1 Tax=Adineta steineri TaxID=433720 RepID=A0A815GY38_9BILA|nr:unnamed protein product [Adineta steineri]CAF1343947.1 unnamed protein product [Adineta steineri]CAF3581741.1 unnamed protein product [Adineta steineri]CAF3679081.1 unnamed protein product [Adineta steineri]
MNVLSQPLPLPSSRRRRGLITPRSPTFVDAAPVAVSNKIRAIQARKSRLTLVSPDAVYTDIRQLNFGYNNGVSQSRTELPVLTPERLVDRSRDIRYDRISARRSSRPTVIVNTNNNQQSIFWSNYQPLNKSTKQPQTQSNSIAYTPPGVGSAKNKSPIRKISELPRRQIRQPSVDQHTSLIRTETKEKSSLKPQPLLSSRIQSRDRTLNNNNNNNHHNLQTPETLDNEEHMIMDAEFEEYLEKAIVKCADWLIKYVFI